MNKSWKGVIHYRSKLILSLLFSSKERKACFEWEFSIVKKIAGKIEISRTTSQYVKRHLFQFGKHVSAQNVSTNNILMLFMLKNGKSQISHVTMAAIFTMGNCLSKLFWPVLLKGKPYLQFQ